MKGLFPQCENCTSRGRSLFKECSHEELDLMDSAKNCSVYKKGQTIFDENNRPYGIHCVLEGKVKLTKLGSEGKEQIVRLARNGDVLGYRAVLTNDRYSASAVALDDCKICFIPLDTFRHVLDENPKVASDMLRMLSRALSDAEEKLVTLALKPVRERLAETLLLLDKVYGEDQQQEENFTISISREDLASMVGTAKETVIRFLSELKDEGVVTAKGSTITIHNRQRLAQISTLYD